MKKYLVVLAAVFLVGCSNGKTESSESFSSSEKQEVTLDSSAIKSANDYVKEFNENAAGSAEMSFNDKNNALEFRYTSKDSSEVIKRLSSDLSDVKNFNSLVIMAQKAQENSDAFEKVGDQISIDLFDTRDDKLPLYSIKKDSISFPASEKSFGGKLPNIISKKMPLILKNANFLFQPKGISEYDQDSNEIKVMLNMTQEQIDYNANNSKMTETLKKSALTLYETNDSVYSEKYPITLINGGKEVLKIDDGEVIEENW